MGRVYLLHFESRLETMSWIAHVSMQHSIAQQANDLSKPAWERFQQQLSCFYLQTWVQGFFGFMILANFLINVAETSLNEDVISRQVILYLYLARNTFFSFLPFFRFFTFFFLLTERVQNIIDGLWASDVIFTSVFGVELVLNMLCHFFLPFWKDGWNIFDFVVVTFSIFALLPTEAWDLPAELSGVIHFFWGLAYCSWFY